MPMKGTGEPTLTEIDRWEHGIGWLAYPDEGMQRASHALAIDGDVWVVDPVDAPRLDDLLADFGTVAGVVVGADRHVRDADAIAARHDVPVYLPQWLTRAEPKIDAPIQWFSDRLEGSDVRAIKVRDSRLPPWQEAALYWPDEKTLVVPEALGTVPYYCTSEERIGVHPLLRPVPPRSQFGDLSPDRILVSHGEGITQNATLELQNALGGARKRTLALYAKTAKRFLLP